LTKLVKYQNFETIQKCPSRVPKSKDLTSILKKKRRKIYAFASLFLINEI
jgi:hypothetical protein